ncbi:hypothetical protein Cni_G00144 [Canna indica]|uniref:Protein FMP32, mitochondrial n=1 Tax=Canna indica TaxID=4628 RepID=A0AAQ3JLU4_9LILI|nr:hypothetical protein Cni_G00144 [Canna indica]
MLAATIASRRRVAALGFRSRSSTQLLADSSLVRHFSSQLIQTSENRAYHVDTLALVRRLEKEGLPTKQAEAITSTITEILNDSLQNINHSFVSKLEMEKSEVMQESKLSNFKAETKSSQEHHFALLQRETEKLRGDIEKMRTQLRYEIDKVTSGQRLDLNLEKGHIRDELNKQASANGELTSKLDREIHALGARLEAAKYEVIKYCIGTLLSLSALSVAVVRLLL